MKELIDYINESLLDDEHNIVNSNNGLFKKAVIIIVYNDNEEIINSIICKDILTARQFICDDEGIENVDELEDYELDNNTYRFPDDRRYEILEKPKILI